MGLFKTFLEFHDNLKQAWITLKLLEPLHTLATRAARSAASGNKSCIPHALAMLRKSHTYPDLNFAYKLHGLYMETFAVYALPRDSWCMFFCKTENIKRILLVQAGTLLYSLAATPCIMCLGTASEVCAAEPFLDRGAIHSTGKILPPFGNDTANLEYFFQNTSPYKINVIFRKCMCVIFSAIQWQS